MYALFQNKKISNNVSNKIQLLIFINSERDGEKAQIWQSYS